MEGEKNVHVLYVKERNKTMTTVKNEFSPIPTLPSQRNTMEEMTT